MRALSLHPFLRSRPHREEQQARVVGGRLESSFPKALHDLAFLLRVAEACSVWIPATKPSTPEAGRNPRTVGQQRDQPGQGRVQQVLPAEGQVQPPAPSKRHPIPEQQPAGRATGPTTQDQLTPRGSGEVQFERRSRDSLKRLAAGSGPGKTCSIVSSLTWFTVRRGSYEGETLQRCTSECVFARRVIGTESGRVFVHKDDIRNTEEHGGGRPVGLGNAGFLERSQGR
ncbi:hypothetical protein Bbelb_239360 [Branchiostoma belcheri]|nr:hypothetical protein Bbelb_239360 [Branchiostoma belcheri]